MSRGRTGAVTGGGPTGRESPVSGFVEATLAQAESLAAAAAASLREMTPVPAPRTTPDRRASRRTYTIYRLVRVESGNDEGFARCRNLSNEGARIQAKMALLPGDRIVVAFSPLAEIPARVVWTHDGECGVAFDHPIDSAALLHSLISDASADTASPLHLHAEMPAIMRFEGHSWRTIASEISLRGMKLAHQGGFTPGLHVKVLLEDGHERGAVVWWAEPSALALSLLDPFNVEDLGSVRALRR